MNILIAFGTRPEWLKIKPLVAQLVHEKISYKLIFTGQHADLLRDIKVEYKITQSEGCKNRLNSVVANILLWEINEMDSFSHVLVQGDTSSAFAMALWAFHNKIKIIHLEAGLRTHDLNHPYPEEANRQLISRIADIHLCATEANKRTLLSERLATNESIHVVGNTVLDNIAGVIPSYGNKVLVTLHRRENHEIISEWFYEIESIAQKYDDLEFILPLHPNPCVSQYKNIFKHVMVVNPLEHTDLIGILKDCKFVITDSGGIQEEASFLNKKIIICRKTTERAECLESHGILCLSPNDLSLIVEDINSNYKVDAPCPFGNGFASKLITQVLKKYDDTRL